MIRTFKTHDVRKQMELTESLWEFEPCAGNYAGQKFPVAVPGCWENHPLFADYRGEGIYRKTFQAQGNVRIECKGVSHTATVYLDGHEIGHHYNAYTPFSVVVSDLEPGRHMLEIKADNRFHKDSALHVPNDYMSYGGISRGVVVEELSDLYLEYVHVKTYRENEQWHVQVKAAVNVLKIRQNDEEDITIQGKIKDTAFEWKLTDTAKKHYEFCTDLKIDGIEEWSPETPVLYQVELQMLREDEVIDDLIERFGFREICVQGKYILLNGKKLRIKGVCRHEDHPDYGCALPYQTIYNDLVLIRQMGANSIRTAHYPNDEIFLDLCDELGILVWEENHARGLEEDRMKHPLFEEQAEQVIREMIFYHYNHPCIFIWGILNECASETLFGRSCYEKQFRLIREMDDSRPCTFASCKFFGDICFDLPDVISCNLYPRWYVDKPVRDYLNEVYDWIVEDGNGKGKPFIVSEIGAGGLYGCHNAYHGKWTEEYQADALSEQVSECLKFSESMGVYIWQFCDVRVSSEWFAGRPREMNNKGIVDEYRRPKAAYGRVKEIFEQYSNYYEE
ncbi:glycoside hydrolase family 2 protein [Jutongia sp.]